MTYSTHDEDERSFPFDPMSVTGIRVDGSPNVVSVALGTGHVVTAGGETWFHWEQGGVRHAVSSRHIAEVLAKRQAPAVIDLTDSASELVREISQLRRGARH